MARMKKYNDFSEDHIKKLNQVISEYWNGNEPQQNWDIDTYKEKNSEGLCGYYKKQLYINKNKEGKLDYNMLQEYAITQFNKITNNEI